jgi:hypothetical protein
LDPDRIGEINQEVAKVRIEASPSNKRYFV